MKIRIVSIFIFISFNLFAQLEKGDWLVDLSAGISLNNQIGNDFDYVFGGFSPSAGYMFSDKFMAGMGLSFSGFGGLGDNTNSINSGNYSVSPFLRYYIKWKPKLIAFGFLETKLNSRKIAANLNYIAEGSAFGSWAGFGLDYFFAPNIALEIKAGTRLFNSGDYDIFPNESDLVFLDLGFRTFLHDRFIEPFDLKDNYLKKGNYILSGSGYFSTVNNVFLGDVAVGLSGRKREGYQFRLKPRASFFKTDNWVLGGGVNIGYLGAGKDYNIYAGLEVNSQYFIPLSERLYVVPSIELGFSRNTTKAQFYHFVSPDGSEVQCGLNMGGVLLIDSMKTTINSNVFKGGLGVALYYFTEGNVLLNGGMSFSRSGHFRNGDNINTRNFVALYVGAEYYFAENLAVTGRFEYSHTDLKSSCLGQNLFDFSNQAGNFSFGLKYLIFNKGEPVTNN